MGRKAKSNSLMVLDASSEPNWRGSKSLQRVFETVPLDEITGALVDSGDEKAIRLAERLLDGKFDRANLAKHCAAVQIQPREVWNILIETRKLSARLALSEKLVDIVDSVTDAATTKIAICPRCDATGNEPSENDSDPPKSCSTCGGSGKLVQPGDKESQKMALEIGEMLNVRVPLVAQQFNTFKPTSGPAASDAPNMADWTRETDKLFEEVVDAEVVE